MNKENMELLFYENDKISGKSSIFLAGPTLRNDRFINSWRYEAVNILRDLGFKGSVYIPESKTGDYKSIGYSKKEYSEWEWERLEKSDIILFWIPRKLDILPGFTTNIEFGRYITLCPEKVVLGYPSDSPKNEYLGLLYERFNKDGISYELKETIEKALWRMDLFKKIKHNALWVK